jgi:hypothetical protein
MASQSTRRIAAESVRPQTLRAMLAGAAVAALTAYVTAVPAIAHSAENPAQTNDFTAATTIPPQPAVSGRHAIDTASAKAFAAGRVIPVDDDNDWEEEQAQEQQQQDEEEQQAELQQQQDDQLQQQLDQQLMNDEQQAQISEQEAEEQNEQAE